MSDKPQFDPAQHGLKAFFAFQLMLQALEGNQPPPSPEELEKMFGVLDALKPPTAAQPATDDAPLEPDPEVWDLSDLDWGET